MDFKKMTDEDILQYCKNHQIKYLNTKGNIYTRKTLIKYIMSSIDKKNNIQQNHIPQNDILPQYINKVVWTLEEKQDSNENYKKIKDNLFSVIKKCHQLLYSSNAIVGIKAQNDIMKILTLKILQPQFNNKKSQLYKKCEQLFKDKIITIDDFNEYMSYCCDLNILNNLDDGKNPLNEWKIFVGYFLIKSMDSLYDINDNRFNFDDEITFMKLIEIINELKINDEFIDAFSTSYGDIHEAFRVYGGGKGAKELGQFFTPRHLIHSIFNGCGFNDIIKSYQNPTIYDPCMGTGGLLTRAYSNGNILPNNIYGCEMEKDTIKFGECSILLTTNEFNSNLIRCDSICNNPYLFEKKFDIIFTNPPFGTKMNYNELEKKYNEYNSSKYPINFKSIYSYKSNNGACLFIQHCMYMLNENGTCAIVLPDGELFTGKTFTKFRKFMCDNINILKIIRVEGGAFEYTSIKTSIIIFQKNGSTKNIEFMDINKECNEVKSNTILNINNIINKNYSFNLNDYIQKENKINKNAEIKKLGDICEIKYGTRIVKKNITNGDFPCYGGGDISFYINEYNREGFNILISRFGLSEKCVRILNTKFYLNDSGLTIHSKDKNISEKYIAYYLYNNQNIIYNIARGTAQKNLDIEKFKELEIPIPSLEYQEIIIKNIEKISKSIETIKLRITQLKEESKLFIDYYKKSEINQLNENAEIKKLGDVCTFEIGGTPSRNNPSYYNGNNLWVSVRELNNNIIYDTKEKITDEGVKNSNVKLFQKGTILFSFKLTIGKMGIVGIPLYTNEAIAGINTKDVNLLTNSYVYYYLKNKDFNNSGSGVFSNGSLNKSSIYDIEIPIPSLEDQEKIINIYKELEEMNKNKFLDKIEEENKHIQLLNELSNKIFNQ